MNHLGLFEGIGGFSLAARWMGWDTVAMFESLGLSVSDLMAMSPENRFEKIGKTVAGIKDPALRTAMAMDVFGKSGSSLMDFFAGLDENKSKADQLGITITDIGSLS